MYIELNEQNIHNYLSKNDEILISNNIKSVLCIFKSVIDNNNKTIYNKNKNYIYILFNDNIYIENNIQIKQMILIVINLCNFNDIKIYSKHTNENKYYYDLNKKISITYNNNKIDIHDIYTFEYLKIISSNYKIIFKNKNCYNLYTTKFNKLSGKYNILNIFLYFYKNYKIFSINKNAFNAVYKNNSQLNNKLLNIYII